MEEIKIINTAPEHGPQIYDVIRLAYGGTLDDDCITCIDAEATREQIARFPEGQFVAVMTVDGEELVVGMASTMRTRVPPTEPPRVWMDAIGSLGIANHEPTGEWLYGVEASVRLNYQGRGIGTALYHARFDLVKKLNLRGWYAGGMLAGYHRYRNQMPVEIYAEKVMQREIHDPTVTMQMNRGFEARGLIKDYIEDAQGETHAMLIVWNNPDFRE